MDVVVLLPLAIPSILCRQANFAIAGQNGAKRDKRRPAIPIIVSSIGMPLVNGQGPKIG